MKLTLFSILFAFSAVVLSEQQANAKTMIRTPKGIIVHTAPIHHYQVDHLNNLGRISEAYNLDFDDSNAGFAIHPLGWY